MSRSTVRALLRREDIQKGIRAALRANAPVAIPWATMQLLIEDLGGLEPVIIWLVSEIEETGRPLAFAIPIQDQGVSSFWLFPKSWGLERRDGYAAGLHEEISNSIGPYAEASRD